MLIGYHLGILAGLQHVRDILNASASAFEYRLPEGPEWIDYDFGWLAMWECQPRG